MRNTPADPVHPELRSTARLLPRRAVGPRSLPLVRASLRLLSLLPDHGGAEVVPVGAEVTLRVHRPATVQRPGAAYLWVHGGGFVIGTAQQDDALCRRVAAELGIVVAAVDYRLAPEHPYPVPLEDCYAGLRALAELPGVNRDRLAIGGASAGGGLAAGLALLAHDRGELTPVLQVLAYPMLDDRTATGPDPHPQRRRLWSGPANAFGWECYLGTPPGAAATSPFAAPARATDLRGLPPAWIGVGTHDLFHDEDLAYAQLLRDAGVPCELHVVGGAFHGFDAVVPRAAVSREFGRAQLNALREAFDRESSRGRS